MFLGSYASFSINNFPLHHTTFYSFNLRKPWSRLTKHCPAKYTITMSGLCALDCNIELELTRNISEWLSRNKISPFSQHNRKLGQPSSFYGSSHNVILSPELPISISVIAKKEFSTKWKMSFHKLSYIYPGFTLTGIQRHCPTKPSSKFSFNSRKDR